MIPHFTKKVDLRSRKSILAYLENHPMHADGWSTPTLANCIKVYHLPIPRDLADSAWAYLDAYDGQLWGEELRLMIEDFENESGFRVYTAGRCGGWLECHGRGNNPITIKDDAAEAETFGDLKYLALMCLEFDQFCDDVLENFIDCVAGFKYEKEQEQIEAERESAALVELPFPAMGV